MKILRAKNTYTHTTALTAPPIGHAGMEGSIPKHKNNQKEQQGK